MRKQRNMLGATLATLCRDRRGTAATEFALVAVLLIVGLLNTIDFGIYLYTRMQVENAAEMAAQTAWKTCNDPMTMLPATTNCAGLNAAIAAAIQSTPLGKSISLVSGSPSEGYYCVNSSNTLQSVGSLSSKPADCSAAGNKNLQPGDYLLVQVTYPYAPLFAGVSAMSATGLSAITMTSWMRLG
jgi:Flp pilus assembly protein TadG